MDDTPALVEVSNAAELRDLLGEVRPAALVKERARLHDLDRAWLAASPFCLVATANADGTCDVSPKGDPPGFTLVLDEATIALPERPGNARGDGLQNILSNPHVGLIYFLPGRGDTLRINGRARLVREAPFLDQMIVKGHRPVLATVVEIEQVFHHCSKAFLRSALWQPDTWRPEAVPRRSLIAKTFERRDETVEELDRYYGSGYLEGLYRRR